MLLVAPPKAGRDELPSFPSKPDHRPCSRHRKVRHVAREGRCGEERQTAWLFSSFLPQGREQSKRGQGRQPRMEEDRRLAGVPACRNRVAEIGSRIRGSQKLEDGPLPEWTSFFERAGATPRGDHLGTSVERRLPRALRVTGRYFHRTNPLQLVGAHATEKSCGCEQPGSMTCSKLVHALPKEGTSGCYAADILHGMAAARSLGRSVRSRRSSERAAREHEAATEVSEVKIETYFAFSKHAGTSVPGR